MEIEYTNVKDYIFFLAERYAPSHYEPICAICLMEESGEGTSIKRLLTFVLAYCEAHLSRCCPLVNAITELLSSCYAEDMEPKRDLELIN